MADDLMAGNARVMRAAPFAADLMKVRMADAAIGDLDDDVVRAGLAAGDRQRLERTIGGVGATGFGGHATLLDEAALRRALGPAEDRCRRRGIRSEERRGGKESVSTGWTGWVEDKSKTKKRT